MAEQTNQNQIATFDKKMALAKNVKELFEIPDVKERAIKGYEATTGRKDGENKFQQERYAYLEIIHQKPEFRSAPMWVHFKVINKVMHNGWSLRDNRIYLQPVKRGDEIVDIKVDPSPAVRREMMELMENVKKAPEAQIVLKGDVFKYDKLNQKILVHETTEKTVADIKLENILCSYQRIIWKDNSVTDVVVPHDDLVQAKKKSKIKSSDSGLWAEFPGEACKKTATNRAFRLYHKYPDNAVLLDLDDDETLDVTHQDVPSYEPEDSYTETDGGDVVDTDTGEVHDVQVDTEPKKENKPRKQMNLLADED